MCDSYPAMMCQQKSLSASVTCVLEQSNSTFPLNREGGNSACLPKNSHLGLLGGRALQLLVGGSGTSSTNGIYLRSRRGMVAAVLTCHCVSSAPSSLPHAWGMALSLRVPHCSSCQQQRGRLLQHMIYGEFAPTIAWHWSTQSPQHFVRRLLGDE